MSQSLKSRFYGPLVAAWLALSIGSIVVGVWVWTELDQSFRTSMDTARAELALAAPEGPAPQAALALQETETATRRQLQRSLLATLAIGLLSLATGVRALHLARVANERARNERQLLEQALRAERAAQEKSLFMANMSHEIRTPMNAILGFSEMLASELPPESKNRQRAQAIRASALSLLQLINDILDLSKIEAGMLEIHREPIDVREITEFMRTIFAQQAVRKALQFEVTLADELPRALLLDRTRLQQILVNLLANALKFTSKGRVTLRALWTFMGEDRRSGRLVFEVTDTGVGIPVTKHEAVFQPFVQVDPPSAEGTGLGLSIVRRLADRMGGKVTLESAIGRGSTFRLIFDGTVVADEAAAPAEPAVGGAVDFDDLRAALLLVADDNALNRELLGDMFASTHHTVHFANNGREAVQSVQVSRPDAVLMDLRMPEMDGRAALAAIHRLPGCAGLPVIAVSASSIRGEEPALREMFAAHVRKPFTREAIFQALAAILPRQARSAPDRPAPVDRPAAMAETPQHWPGLIRELTQLQCARWPEVRETGAVGDVRQFARQLGALAQAHGCPSLQAYAEALQREADEYAVNRIERRLADFPRLIQAIGERSLPASPPVAT